MQNKAILCVDDEMIILLSLIQELKSDFGDSFLYAQAINAENAMRIIDEYTEEGIQVILIITDWLMPGIKGDEFLEMVHRKNPGIKAIMITGNADESMIEHVRGFESILAVLKKPWSSEELKGIIQSKFLNDGSPA